MLTTQIQQFLTFFAIGLILARCLRAFGIWGKGGCISNPPLGTPLHCGASSPYHFINRIQPSCTVDLPAIVQLLKHTFCLRHVSCAIIGIPLKIYRAGKVPIRDLIFHTIQSSDYVHYQGLPVFSFTVACYSFTSRWWRTSCRVVYLSVRPVFLTAVAVFRKPNAIPLCFSIDTALNFLLSWLLVLLPSTFSLDLLLSFSPAVSNIKLILLFSSLAFFWPGHTTVVFSTL